jgi:hypothetical protein
MKKLILAAFALTTAASVLAQGTVTFVNNYSGWSTRVWGPSATAPSLSLTGNSPTDNPAGTTDYAGAGMLRVGSVGTLAGTTTFAQLLAANGAGAPEASLVPQGGTTTFRSGSAAGVMGALTVTLTTVPADSPAATFKVAAWDNSSGLYPNWQAAMPAWEAGLIAGGLSPVFAGTAIGGADNTPPFLPIPSFNLYMNVIPEPSSFALAGLGAAALLIFRRRK